MQMPGAALQAMTSNTTSLSQTAMPPDELAKPGKDKPLPQDTAPVSGELLIDATVAEQQMEYPTDLKLLNEIRDQWERICRLRNIKADSKVRYEKL